MADKEEAMKKPPEKKPKRAVKEWTGEESDYKILEKVQKQFVMLQRVVIILLFKEKATKRGEVTVPSKTYTVKDRDNALMYHATKTGMAFDSPRMADFLVVIGADFWEKCNATGKEDVLFRACCAMRFDAEEGPSINPPDFNLYKKEMTRKRQSPEVEQVFKLAAVQLKLPFGEKMQPTPPKAGPKLAPKPKAKQKAQAAS